MCSVESKGEELLHRDIVVEDATKDRQMPDIVAPPSVIKPTMQPSFRHLSLSEKTNIVCSPMGAHLTSVYQSTYKIYHD